MENCVSATPHRSTIICTLSNGTVLYDTVLPVVSDNIFIRWHNKNTSSKVRKEGKSAKRCETTMMMSSMATLAYYRQLVKLTHRSLFLFLSLCFSLSVSLSLSQCLFLSSLLVLWYWILKELITVQNTLTMKINTIALSSIALVGMLQFNVSNAATSLRLRALEEECTSISKLRAKA